MKASRASGCLTDGSRASRRIGLLATQGRLVRAAAERAKRDTSVSPNKPSPRGCVAAAGLSWTRRRRSRAGASGVEFCHKTERYLGTDQAAVKTLLDKRSADQHCSGYRVFSQLADRRRGANCGTIRRCRDIRRCGDRTGADESTRAAPRSPHQIRDDGQTGPLSVRLREGRRPALDVMGVDVYPDATQLADVLWRGEGLDRSGARAEASLHSSSGLWERATGHFVRSWSHVGRRQARLRRHQDEHGVHQRHRWGQFRLPVRDRQGRGRGKALTATSIRSAGVRIQSGAEPHGLGRQPLLFRGAAQGLRRTLSPTSYRQIKQLIRGRAGRNVKNSSGAGTRRACWGGGASTLSVGVSEDRKRFPWRVVAGATGHPAAFEMMSTACRLRDGREQGKSLMTELQDATRAGTNFGLAIWRDQLGC